MRFSTRRHILSGSSIVLVIIPLFRGDRPPGSQPSGMSKNYAANYTKSPRLASSAAGTDPASFTLITTLYFRQGKVVWQGYCRECSTNLWLKFWQCRRSHFPDYVIINLLIVKDMDKVIPYSSQLMPWYFRMSRPEILRDMRRCLAYGGYIKRRCILQLVVFKEFLLANTDKHFFQTLDSLKHMKKPLNVSIHTVNHTSDISLRTL